MRSLSLSETDSRSWLLFKSHWAGVIASLLVLALITSGAWWYLRVRDPLAHRLEQLSTDPNAALDYFAPEPPTTSQDQAWSPSDQALTRWEGLHHRHWGSQGINALAQALAQVATLRTPSPQHTDEKASWVTAQGITLLAQHHTYLSTTGRQAVGTILANCGAELTLLSVFSEDDPGIVGVDESEPYQTAPMIVPGQENKTGQNTTQLGVDMTTLINEASKDTTTVATIAAGTITYASNRAQATIDKRIDTYTNYDKEEAIARAFDTNIDLLARLDKHAQKAGSGDNAASSSVNTGAAAALVALKNNLIPTTLAHNQPWLHMDNPNDISTATLTTTNTTTRQAYTTWAIHLPPDTSITSTYFHDILLNRHQPDTRKH
ncbi:DUF6571 family protein [Actinomyces capricornis]|uniref:Uncharacterized protein n=1 Tax=Actinomyces capricornis TaxID=2755559 RepID=A0ABN6K4S5_9ACTO|nr:DUF6571 family protein [Actinomyces capricornis]BDA64606.1 hypothetical protein MANAM107_14400 [Actinomyces capricornis]